MAETGLRVAVAARNQIGESPVWSGAERALYWVDVEGNSIQRWREHDHSVQSWDVGEAIGCIGLRAKGGLVGARRQTDTQRKNLPGRRLGFRALGEQGAREPRQ